MHILAVGMCSDVITRGQVRNKNNKNDIRSDDDMKRTFDSWLKLTDAWRHGTREEGAPGDPKALCKYSPSWVTYM